MNLFDEMPHIEGERIQLREFVDTDADQLDAFTRDERVYRFLPTFLYEQKYDDKHLAIARMRSECFDTHESILMAVSPLDDPSVFMGIAEFYAFEPRKPKVSIGYRLAQPFWGHGFATEISGLLKRYLLEKAQVRTITAHIMKENIASARAVEKNGFRCLYPNVWEDWSRGEDVLVDKWIYKRRWETEETSDD